MNVAQVNLTIKFSNRFSEGVMENMISSVGSQKGAINIPRCSAENQKGAIAVKILWR